MDRKFKWGQTPLEFSLRTLSEDCAITLVLWGCKLNKNEKGLSVFYQAANEGLILLLKVLSMFNPFVFNEDWLVEEKLPQALYSNHHCCEWLKKNSRQPPTLFNYCRYKINKYLGKYACSKINDLDLPKTIISRLKFEELLPKDMYREANVLDDNCPFDCLSTCPQYYCERIEINDSTIEFKE